MYATLFAALIAAASPAAGAPPDTQAVAPPRAERVVRESTVPVLIVPKSVAGAALRDASTDDAAAAEPSVVSDRWSNLAPVPQPRRMP